MHMSMIENKHVCTKPYCHNGCNRNDARRDACLAFKTLPHCCSSNYRRYQTSVGITLQKTTPSISYDTRIHHNRSYDRAGENPIKNGDHVENHRNATVQQGRARRRQNEEQDQKHGAWRVYRLVGTGNASGSGNQSIRPFVSHFVRSKNLPGSASSSPTAADPLSCCREEPSLFHLSRFASRHEPTTKFICEFVVVVHEGTRLDGGHVG